MAKLKIPSLGYVWGGQDYAKAIDACASKGALVKYLRGLGWLALDALEDAQKITDWSEFKAGLESERRGVFAGEEWAAKYGTVLLPVRMLVIETDVAMRFHVPFGTAYIRLKEHVRDLEAWFQERLSAASESEVVDAEV